MDQSWLNYQLFGLTICSNFPFVNRLVASDGQPDLIFRCQIESRSIYEKFIGDNTPKYRSPYLNADDVNWLEVYCVLGVTLVHFPAVALFEISAATIQCYADPSAELAEVELYFLGYVMTIVLEQRGIPALHASSVAVNEQAVAFLACSTGGKSSVAATLIADGHALLSDDIVPIKRIDDMYFALSGYPQMRMWPDLANYFLENVSDLPLVDQRLSKLRVPVGPMDFGTFHTGDSPIRCIYVPVRVECVDEQFNIEFSNLNIVDAMLAVTNNSFAGAIVEALGLQKGRFEFFATLLAQIPVRRIRYASGFDFLPMVRQAILDDIADLG